MLKLNLNGTLSLTDRNNQELLIRSSRARAMLALLATAPRQKRSREFLQAALWPNSPSAQSRGSLRTELSALRRALGEYHICLMADRSIIQLVDIELIFEPDVDAVFFEDAPTSLGEEFDDWLRAYRVNSDVETLIDEYQTPILFILETVMEGYSQDVMQTVQRFFEQISRLAVAENIHSKNFNMKFFYDENAKAQQLTTHQPCYFLVSQIKEFSSTFALELRLHNTNNMMLCETYTILFQKNLKHVALEEHINQSSRKFIEDILNVFLRDEVFENQGSQKFEWLLQSNQS